MRESGSVSVLTVAAVSILVLMAPAVLDMGNVVKARARAHNAADAAALAAAQELIGSGDPIAAAHEYADANKAEITGLSIGKQYVIVTVSVDCRTPFISQLGLNLGPVRGQGKAELMDVPGLDY